MNTSNGLYRERPFLLMTLDPVHIGTGGQHLGRVDLSIAREPGTRLPKIPGTSLSGAVRQYAACRYESRRCAGAGQGDGDKGHCRDPQCPICYTFGYLRGQDGGQSGTVSIGDARLLLFPVYSVAGPVWVTCPGILRELGVTGIDDPGERVQLPKALLEHDHLNLGWLMLKKVDNAFDLPDTIEGVPDEIKHRAVLISDRLFSQVVNSNLEVRTSVSIDPVTGAAKDGALFTYEAIPRATLLWLDVVEDDFRRNPEQPRKFPAWPVAQTKLGKAFPNDEKWESPLDVVCAGLRLAEHLGIGGMGTRGFGRVRLLNGEVPQCPH